MLAGVPAACAARAAPAAGGAPDAARRLAEARALQQRGALDEARGRLEALAAELRGRAPSPELGGALVALSQLAAAGGDYGLALAHAREAGRACRASGDAGCEGRALNALAVAEVYRGEYAQGLADLPRALERSRAAGDREAEVEELNNTGTALFLQARYLEAERAYRAADEVAERAAGEPWQPRRRRVTRANLAALYQRIGAYERALDLYRAAQAAPDALGASEQARVLTNLGTLYRRLEDPVKALETYQAARRLLARERHVDGEIGVLKNIGIVHALDLGDLGAALRAFTRALALAERNHDPREVMQARLYRGETRLRLGDPEGARVDLEAALAAADALATTEERWKALYALGRVERARGRDDAAAARFRAAVEAIESVRSRLQLAALRTDFLADKRDVYDALVELLAERGATAEVFDLLERSRARTLQDRLREGPAGDGAPPATLAAVQRLLSPDTVLLEYWLAGDAAAVVWLTRDASGLARLAAPPGAELAAFARELSGGEGSGWRRGARALGERLLAGIEPLARTGLRHVLVVPDGPLSAVPFEALELPGAGGALVVERLDVTYLPAASLLLREPPRDRRFAPPWERRLVAFGDPVAAPSRPGALDEEPRERLPSSAEEVRAIARLVGGGRAELHLGPENRKRYLLEGRARGVPLVHLSTHATADDAGPERSRILFSPEAPDGPADYLFLKEVFDLDLRGVDLTTLSACETERGRFVRGEGLQAFSRALLSAGSRAAVTTLWRVADRPTAELMKQLYFHLGRGAPKAEALREAKLRFLRSGTPLAHPRFWAAFVLSGDGLTPVPRAVAWTDLFAIALAAGLAAAAAVVVTTTRRAARGRAEGPAVPPGRAAAREATARGAAGTAPPRRRR